MRWQDSTGRFGAKDAGTLAALVSPTEGESFLSAASEGAMLLADLAAEAVARAISEHGDGADHWSSRTPSSVRSNPSARRR